MISERINDIMSYTERLSLHKPYLSYLDRLGLEMKYYAASSDLSNSVDSGYGDRIVEILSSYGVDVKLHSVECGPVLNRVNVEPAIGVKVRSIESLSNEIAIGMKASKVSIVLRPEIGCVAIDMPSATRKVVLPGNLMGVGKESERMELPLELGVGVTGEGRVIDLTKTPHMLIAGQTGSGKSVCINSIVASLLKNVREDRYDLLLVDPKGVELGGYAGLPNVVNHKVLVTPEESLEGLSWLVDEMERRYKLLARAGKRTIKDFNKSIDDGSIFDKLPVGDCARMRYVVCIVDEFADLMLNCGKELTECMMKLAQKSRAVGIHVILATQRPSVDVVTGALKANLPTCIAFKVKSAVDSMTILGCSGAEKLLGNGDMLMVTPTSDTPERIHGVYFDDATLNGIVSWVMEDTVEYILRTVDFKLNYTKYTKDIGEVYLNAVIDQNPRLLAILKGAGAELEPCLAAHNVNE